MAKNTLPVNFKDDIMNSSMGGKRRYKMINNSDGTISLEDATTYDQVGSNFGAAQLNATNQAVNAAADAGKIIDDINAIRNVTKEGYMAGALALKQVDESLEEQPQFVYDEEGKITGYTTKIGGADTVFPFINDDILVCARLQPTNSQETAFSVGNFKIPSDGVYKIYFVSITSYWSSGTVTIGNDIAFEIPTYNNYTAGNHIFEEERECKTGEEINIISHVVAGTLCILLYKIT